MTHRFLTTSPQFDPIRRTALARHVDSSPGASLREPLADLDDALAEVDRDFGAHGVVDLLVVALTDRWVRRDTDIDPYLDRLKSACRQTRRYREAIPVFARVAALNPERRHEMAAELALVHAHLGEHAQGMLLLKSAVAEQRRLSAWQRSPRFCLVAELAAIILRDQVTARALAVMSRSAGQPRLAGFVPLARPHLAVVRAA